MGFEGFFYDVGHGVNRDDELEKKQKGVHIRRNPVDESGDSHRRKIGADKRQHPVIVSHKFVKVHTAL